MNMSERNIVPDQAAPADIGDVTPMMRQ